MKPTLLILLLLTLPALARPYYNSYNCINCHSAGNRDDTDRVNLLNTVGVIDPTEHAGIIDRGLKPFYTAQAGQILTLSAEINLGFEGTNFDVVVTNSYQRLGVQTTAPLAFTPDTNWVPRTNLAGTDFWYTAGLNDGTFTWTEPQTFSFDLAIPQNATPDYYEFVMGWSGLMGIDAGMRTFYVQVQTPTPEPAAPALLALTLTAQLARRHRRR